MPNASEASAVVNIFDEAKEGMGASLKKISILGYLCNFSVLARSLISESLSMSSRL